MGLLNDQRPGNNMTEKYMRKTSGGRSMWTELSKWVKYMKILMSHVNCHQKVTPNQVDRMVHSMDSLSLYSATPVIA
jgi:hypothetical protein